MKSSIGIVAITALLILFLLSGCSQPAGNFAANQNTGDNMANVKDSNAADKNSTNFNNLDSLRSVKAGDTILVNYVGKLKDGSIFDSSIGKSPLTFEVGAGRMIKGFDAAVIGMKVGGSKTVEIPAANAYGEVNPKLVMTFDSNKVPDFDILKVGVSVTAANGASGVVTAKTDTNVTVDFNNRLAGKTLVFEITLLGIQ